MCVTPRYITFGSIRREHWWAIRRRLRTAATEHERAVSGPQNPVVAVVEAAAASTVLAVASAAVRAGAEAGREGPNATRTHAHNADTVSNDLRRVWWE